MSNMNIIKIKLLTAPNEYSIPTVLGSSKEGKIRSAPAYTIIGRQKQTLPQVVQFPGPGTYALIEAHYYSNIFIHIY